MVYDARELDDLRFLREFFRAVPLLIKEFSYRYRNIIPELLQYAIHLHP